MTTYRSREIHRDGSPSPSPSSAPEAVTETADTIKPRLIKCRAVIPSWRVSGLEVNSPNSLSGMNQERMVPRAIIIAERARAVR